MYQAPRKVKINATVKETAQRIAKTCPNWCGAIEQLRFNIHSRFTTACSHYYPPNREAEHVRTS